METGMNHGVGVTYTIGAVGVFGAVEGIRSEPSKAR